MISDPRAVLAANPDIIPALRSATRMRAFTLALVVSAVTAASLAPHCIKQWCPLHTGAELMTPSPEEQVPVMVVLPFLNQDKLDETFKAVNDVNGPRFQKYLTTDEVYDMIGNPNATAAVLDWLRGEGLAPRVSKDRYAVRAVGPVSAVERAFGARYQVFEHKTRTDPRSGKPLRMFRSAEHTVPTHMAEHVSYVAHISDFYENKIKPLIAKDTIKMLRKRRQAARSNATLVDDDDLGDDDTGSGSGISYNWGNIRPASVWAQYKTPCTPDCGSIGTGWTGNGNSHGLYEDGSYASQTDLTTFYSTYVCAGSGAGTAACASGSTTHPTLKVNAGTNDDSQCSFDSNVCGEATLDVQFISAVATPMATLDGYWYTGESASGFASSFTDLAHNLAEDGAPWVTSISYGLDEGELPAATLQSTNTLFQTLGTTGRTIFVASGDAGASNYRGGAVSAGSQYCGFNPSWPAASPYVTAVGATSLSPSSQTSSFPNTVVYIKDGADGGIDGGAEIPSSGGNPYGNQVTTGGGFSCLFQAEPYQQSAISAYQQNSGYYTGGSSGDQSTCGFSATTSTVFNKGGRGYPDVVALGWQYELTLNGSPFPGVAGTSAASPVMAGMFTIINGLRLQNGQPTVGFVNDDLYSAPASAGIFNRLNPGSETSNACTTSGNGCCGMGFKTVPSAKWDAFQGLGTVNFPALSTYFQGLQNQFQ